MSGQALMTKTDGKPVREFTGRSMLWWLGGFFGVMFAANAVFVWFALTSWTGLVVDSSYKAGQAYQGEIDAAHAQAARNWDVAAHVNRTADGNTQLRVNARDAAAAPLTGLPVVATLQRPTHGSEDREITLAEGEAGVYTGAVAGVGAGQWDLLIEIGESEAVVFRSRNRVFLSE